MSEKQQLPPTGALMIFAPPLRASVISLRREAGKCEECGEGFGVLELSVRRLP